jgi:hypothetical protein
VDDDAPTRVLRIDPAPGSAGVFGDAPVVAVLSRPLDRSSVTPESFSVTCGGRPASGLATTSPDGRAIVWTPGRPLTAGVEHHVRATALRDTRGRLVPDFASTFVPCGVTLADLFG